MLTAVLPLLPPGARELSDRLAIYENGDRLDFFHAAGPIYTCRRDDRIAVRLGALTMLAQGLVKVTVLAKALGLHRTTLFRDAKSFGKDGVAGLLKPGGPTEPFVFTPEVVERAQRLLDSGESIRSTAKSIGVSNTGLQHAIKRGLVVKQLANAGIAEPQSSVAVAEHEVKTGVDQADEMVGPSTRAQEDQSCEGGIAVKRTTERGLACVGALVEAGPEFTAAEAVPEAGVLLALPELLEQGLLDVGQDVYGALKNAFFGLRSVMLTFAFMALLRIKNPEQMTEHSPGELGLLLGLDRAPEVKTLRRKLNELGQRCKADTLRQKFAERWAQAEPAELGILYVDGHVRPYHGRTLTLPKLHVQQRGRPMPGTKDFNVNDRRADPLFFVTAKATEGLISTLDAELLPNVRDLVGPDRRVTIAFDREGWSPEFFAKWKSEQFDVLTYRKGAQTKWQRRFFVTHAGQVGGESVKYDLAERAVRLSNGLAVREIRRLMENGHQTSVITTDECLTTLEVAHRMFSRWKQENFFRYMRQEFAIDHLCTYEVEPDDPDRIVTCPERAALAKKLHSARTAYGSLLLKRREVASGIRIRVGKEMLDSSELDERIQSQQRLTEQLARAIQEMPKTVPISELMELDAIVRLERERKTIADVMKHTAYRAESTLARLVEPLFARHQDEARKFLKCVFNATADILPDPSAKTLTVRFHGLSSPRMTRALADLCAIVTETATCYPGTDLRLRFEAPTLQ